RRRRRATATRARRRRRSRRPVSASATRSARGGCSCDRGARASPTRRGRGRPPTRPLCSPYAATTSGESARAKAPGAGPADTLRPCPGKVASCNPHNGRSTRPIPAKLFLASGATSRCARPGLSLDLVDPERPRALRDDRGDDRLLVDLAELEARRLFAQVVVAPLAKRGERDVQVETLLRQVVLVPLRALAVQDSFEHAFVDE